MVQKYFPQIFNSILLNKTHETSFAIIRPKSEIEPREASADFSQISERDVTTDPIEVEKDTRLAAKTPQHEVKSRKFWRFTARTLD